MRLELDFRVVGSVKDKRRFGWLGWRVSEARRSRSTRIGGLRLEEEDALQAGAHGLALIRGLGARKKG